MNNYYFSQMFFAISLDESKRILQLFFSPGRGNVKCQWLRCNLVLKNSYDLR